MQTVGFGEAGFGGISGKGKTSGRGTAADRLRRRRLIAALRLAHRSLGMKRKGLALGIEAAVGRLSAASVVTSSAIALATASGGSAAAQQATDLTNFVDACTGIKVDVPVLDQVTNGLGQVVGLIPGVAGGTVSGLNGQRIGATLLNSNGDVLARPENCGVSSQSGFAVDNDRGIEIGGGVISGLGGTDNPDASTAVASAIAIGNNASAQGVESVAIGSNSASNGDYSLASGNGAISRTTNSIALGRDAQTGIFEGGGTASIAIGYGSRAGGDGAVRLGIGGTATMTGATSVGNGTRAVGGGAVALGDMSSANGTSAFAAGTDAVAVNESAFASGSRASANGVSTVAIGLNTIAAGESALAIGNGAQARADRALSIGAGNKVSGEGSGAIGDPNTVSGAGSYVLGNENTVPTDNTFVLGNNVDTTGSGDGNVVLGNASTVATAVGTANATINGTRYDFAGGVPVATVSVGADGAERTITNLAAGRVTGGSTDAVNGSQLFATNTAIAAASERAVQYDGPAGSFGAITLKGQNGTTITNVAAGTLAADSTDAVNGSQLFATNQRIETVDDKTDALGTSVANNFGGGSTYNATTGDVSAPTYVLNQGTQTFNDVGGALTNLDGRVTDNTNAITNIDNGTIGVVQRTSTEGTVAVTAPGATGDAPGAAQRITNVAAGTVSAASLDAVNGSQLFGTASSFANALGGGASVAANGTVTAPNYRVAGTSYNNVGGAIDALDNGLSSGQIGAFRSDNTAGLGQPVATGANASAGGFGASATGAASTVLGNGASDNGNDNSTVIGNGAQVAAGVGGSNVALGQGSTVTTAAVAVPTATIAGTTYDVAGGRPAGAVSVGSAGAERQIQNVAAGRLSATSTDAVNGSQLFATNRAVDTLSDRITTIGGTAANAVTYDTNAAGDRTNKITLQGGDPNAPVLITNVARGTAVTDAVNKGQVDEGLANLRSFTTRQVSLAIDTSRSYTDKVATTTLSQAKDYTDQRFGELNRDLSGVRSEARQAAAIGLAASSLRYDDRPGKFSVSLGGGYWRSQSAVAFGAGYTDETGRVRANLTGATADGNFGVGGGLTFTLN